MMDELSTVMISLMWSSGVVRGTWHFCERMNTKRETRGNENALLECSL